MEKLVHHEENSPLVQTEAQTGQKLSPGREMERVLCAQPPRPRMLLVVTCRAACSAAQGLPRTFSVDFSFFLT